MFDATQWSGVAFFESVVVVGDDKDFSVTSGESCSLADTASERDDCRSLDDNNNNISLPQREVLLIHSLNNLVNGTPRGSCQKRQKIFDYVQEGHLLATKEAPKLEDIVPKTPTDLEISTEYASKQ